MSKIDIALAILVIIGTISGYRRGFLQEFFSLLAIVLGILAGFKLMGIAIVLLSKHYSINEKVLPYVAFGIVFLIVVILVSWIGKLFKTSLEKTVLGNVDQVAGGMLGMVRSAFMLSVVLWIIHSLSVEIPEHWTADSWLYPVIARFAPAVTSWVGEIFPVFSDLFFRKIIATNFSFIRALV